MKQRVSDYIADFLADNNIKDVFTVPGGGAMYLNDSFGHHEKLHCTYNHHEQASAMAAEAYARVNNNIALVCVTTGPGATNAITGVACGWMDSIPMLIISGQVRYSTTIYASGLKLRTRGIQEFDVIGTVKNMTKYCKLIKDPMTIRYELEKSLYLAKNGRPGPCWLDIPLDVQSAIVDISKLKKYKPKEENREPSLKEIKKIIKKIKEAKRPVLYVGNGVRLANAHDEFIKLVDKLNIPVVTGMSSVDAIPTNNTLYVGRCGITGDRAGNFAVQNSDLLISIGSRLSFLQTGFNYETWAREAYKIVNDIDEQELFKDSVKPDMKLCCDSKSLILSLFNELSSSLPRKNDWIEQCLYWKKKYPVVLRKHKNDKQPNIYAFYDYMTRRLNKNDYLVVSVGTSRVAGSQASYINKGVRFITNPTTASMGYDLPAATGVCIANNYKKTYLVTGDGSLQMNIQELQTIVHNKLPIAIFVMNNQGYHSIRTTQKNYFNNSLVGVGPDSGDISFPDLSKIASAYGIQYKRCERMKDMKQSIEWALKNQGPCICEMILSIDQMIEPKSSSMRLDDGRMVSMPLENMAPFLPEEELNANMIINCYKSK